MNLEEIQDRFTFHPGTPVTGPMHDHVRDLIRNIAVHLATDLPESRELSLALTALEEAMHWSNACVAKYGIGIGDGDGL